MRKRIKRYLSKVETIHACYHFINSFIITLSVKDSLEEAYQNGLRLAPNSLTNETCEIENMTIAERLNFLRQYFNLAIYKMFLNIVGLYIDQGGNILYIARLKYCLKKFILSKMVIFSISLLSFVKLAGASLRPF